MHLFRNVLYEAFVINLLNYCNYLENINYTLFIGYGVNHVLINILEEEKNHQIELYNEGYKVWFKRSVKGTGGGPGSK